MTGNQMTAGVLGTLIYLAIGAVLFVAFWAPVEITMAALINLPMFWVIMCLWPFWLVWKFLVVVFWIIVAFIVLAVIVKLLS